MNRRPHKAADEVSPSHDQAVGKKVEKVMPTSGTNPSLVDVEARSTHVPPNYELVRWAELSTMQRKWCRGVARALPSEWNRDHRLSLARMCHVLVERMFDRRPHLIKEDMLQSACLGLLEAVAARHKARDNFSWFAWDYVRKQIERDFRLDRAITHRTDSICIEEELTESTGNRAVPPGTSPGMAALIEASMEGGDTESACDDPFIDFVVEQWVNEAKLEDEEMKFLWHFVQSIPATHIATKFETNETHVRRVVDRAVQKVRNAGGLDIDDPVAWVRYHHPARMQPSKRERLRKPPHTPPSGGGL